MSKLDKFLAKPLTKQINGEDVTVHPLTMENVGLFVRAGSNEELIKEKAIIDMMNLSLKKSFPEENPERFKELPLEFIGEYMKLVAEVNGLDVEETMGSTKVEELKQKLIQ